MRRICSLALVVSLAALGCGGDEGGDGDGDGDGWSRLADVGGGPIQEIGVAELGGAIYVVGGFDADLQIVTDVRVYDPVADSWDTAAPLPQAVHHANVATLDGKLYVVGAMQTLNFTSVGVTWVYDPGADEWTELSPMPAGSERGAGVAGAIDGKVCLAGGLRGGVTTDELACYDPLGDSWDTDYPAIPTASEHLVGGVVDGVLYVIGGRMGAITSTSDRVYAYDPVDDAWEQKASMPTARGGTAAGVVAGKIYVVGGEGNAAAASGVFPQVEEYDPVADTWTSLGEMLTPRHGMGAAGLDGVLYVPGGATTQGFGAVAAAEAFVP